jgi:ABC-type sugar transport system ATPase subunit
VLDDMEELAVANTYRRRLNIRSSSVLQQAVNLSGGNQQKVVLGRVLRTQPRVLLLDEPTRGVDVGAKAEIYELLGELAHQGLGVLLASSELPELTGVCDRVVVLRHGQSVAEFDTATAGEAELLAAAMGAKPAAPAGAAPTGAGPVGATPAGATRQPGEAP